MKLELKHLAPYLPYGLKFMPTEYNKKINQLSYLSTIHNSEEFGVNGFTSKWIKPILRPLIDLKIFEKELYELCVVKGIYRTEFIYNYSTILNGKIDEKPINIYVYNFLIEYHFDVFGLIDKGLAISIHDIEQADA